MPHPEIPMVSAAEFSAIAGAVDDLFGAEATHEVFARHGFSELLLKDLTMQLPNAEYMRFLETCARVTGEPLLGAIIGDRVGFEELGLYGRYVRAAPCLDTALNRALRALRYHETGSRLDFEFGGGLVRLSYIPPTPKALGSWHQSDGVAALLINLIRSYEGPRWKPAQIRVAVATGVRRARLQDFFEVEVIDRAIGTELVGKIGASQPNQPHRQGAFTWRELREMVSGRPPETFANTLRTLIDALVRAGVFDLARISDSVGIAPRTIQRRLAAEGTTFGATLQESRREWADELIGSTSQGLSEVARQVGYTSKQHFIRAYRGWSGITPSEFRNRKR